MKQRTVEALWKDHLTAPFPGSCSGRDIEGIDLVMLDADIAGCVDTFLKRRRRMDPWRLAVLGICYHHARIVVRGLRGGARVYFERLERLAGAVLLDLVQKTRRR